jgi:hypothetical protein
LGELSPWKGRRAIVFAILDEHRDEQLSYKALRAIVQKRTGRACSSALIAAWKGSKMANDSDYPNDPPPPSPKTGKEKPDRPYA